MANQQVNVKIDQVSVFAPLIAAQLTSAYYNALLLHHMRGVEAKDEEVIRLVNDTWAKITELLSAAHAETKPPNSAT
jgi:hypothetical protein